MDWLENNIILIFGMDAGLLLIQVRRDKKLFVMIFHIICNQLKMFWFK